MTVAQSNPGLRETREQVRARAKAARALAPFLPKRRRVEQPPEIPQPERGEWPLGEADHGRTITLAPTTPHTVALGPALVGTTAVLENTGSAPVSLAPCQGVRLIERPTLEIKRHDVVGAIALKHLAARQVIHPGRRATLTWRPSPRVVRVIQPGWS